MEQIHRMYHNSSKIELILMVLTQRFSYGMRFVRGVVSQGDIGAGTWDLLQAHR